MKRSGYKIMLGLLSLVKSFLPIMALCIGFGVLGFLAAIAITVLGGVLLLTALDVPVSGLSFEQLTVLLIVCAILRGVFRYIEQTCGHYIAFKLLAVIRDKVFTVLRNLAPAKLETRSRGDLIHLISSDIELLEVFYAHTIAPVVIAAIVSLIMSILVGMFHPLLGLFAAFSYFLIAVILPLRIWKKDKEEGLAIRNKLGALNSYFLESIRGIQETKQFKNEKERLLRIQNRTEEINQLQANIKKREAFFFGISGYYVGLLTLMMFLVNVLLYTGFETTLLTTLMLSASFGPVLAISNLAITLTGTLAAGERVLNLLEEEPETKEIIDGKRPEFSGARASDIRFSYGEEEILQDISLEINHGDMVALTGKSGSGKSTLLKLFMRFWSVKSGEISIGEENIEQVNTSHLRNLESYMTQETDLFQGTILDNILIAKSNASLEEVKEAAKKASIHSFIESLPEGYDTKVAELGESLSGGERQRIGLARVFLHDANFILLDEPTANLDSLNEGIILKSLADWKEEKTILLVSHKQSTVGIADKNVHLDSGRMS